MIALNLALILAITSPLWFTKAFVQSNTHWLVAVPPNLTPQQQAAYLHRLATPPMWEVLLREVLLTALTYLLWVLVLTGICRASARHQTISDRLETWSMAARQRVAYLLCWPIPWLGTWVFAFVRDWLLGALRPRSAVREASFTAYGWAVDLWWPTIPVLVFVGLCLAGRRVWRRIRELRGRGDAPPG